MATTRKVLGQHIPAAAATDLMYTVPANTQAVVSSIVCCNVTVTDDQLGIAVVEAGDTIGSKNMLYYLLPITGLNTFTCTIGITMNAGDMLYVYSANGYVAFSAFGQEIT